MRLSVVLFVLCFLGATASAGPDGPLAFPDGAIDLGPARQHAELTKEVPIRNDGTKPLTKIRTLSDCGCYSATATAETLAPGASAKVLIRFRTLSFYGPMSKKLRVAYLDGGKRQTTTVKVKVSVVDGVIVRPGRLFFGQLDAGARPEGFVTVVWHKDVGKPFEIEEITVPNAKVKTTVFPHKDAKRPEWRGWQIQFNFLEPLPRGLFTRKAIVRTNDKEQPEVRIPISAQVVGKVFFQSNRIYIGLVPQGRARSGHVLFRPTDNAAKLDPSAVRAKARKGVLQATVTPAPSRRYPGTWKLEVAVPPTAAIGALDDEIEVTTGVPGEPTSIVRVTGRVYRP